MRIVLDARPITDHFPGIGRYAYNLLAALGRLDHGHELLALYNPGAANTRYDLAALPGVRLLPIGAPPLSLAEQRDVPRLLRAVRADLYHAPYYVRPYRTPCASVTTFYDTIPLRFPQEATPRARLLFRPLHALAARASSRLIAISRHAQDDLSAALHIAPQRFSVVPLAADQRFTPQPPERIAALRARQHLPERYGLCVCSNKPHKNLETLVAAWAQLGGSPAVLVIAGQWDERYPQAKALAARFGLGDTVRWLGPVADADLPALYGGATLFVYPSRYEGFGLPPLEAMACGVPVVCGAGASLPEVTADAALLTDPTDPAALAAAIRRLWTDPALQADLRARGLRQAQNFSWERTARQTLEVYVAAVTAFASPLP